MSLSFRWLGVAGVELNTGDQVLAIDPFFTRPSLMGLLKPVIPNAKLVAEKLPMCQAVLVTHSHWDHLMDVSEVLKQTGAIAYGSSNTCRLLRLLGVPERQFQEVDAGERLSLGEYAVEIIQGQHSWIPFAHWFNGKIKPGLQPPLRLQDYRMDVCLGFRITVMEVRILICAAQPQPADLLFTVAQESREYYQRLFCDVRPHTIVPIHWDNFLRPLSQPQQRFNRPGRMRLDELANLAKHSLPDVNVIIPELFREYTVG